MHVYTYTVTAENFPILVKAKKLDNSKVVDIEYYEFFSHDQYSRIVQLQVLTSCTYIIYKSYCKVCGFTMVICTANYMKTMRASVL